MVRVVLREAVSVIIVLLVVGSDVDEHAIRRSAGRHWRRFRDESSLPGCPGRGRSGEHPRDGPAGSLASALRRTEARGAFAPNCSRRCLASAVVKPEVGHRSRRAP